MFETTADAPPRKPKQPFLKRGEGVNKRLIAYKLRDEAAALRKQRGSTSSNRESRPASNDQYQHGSGTSTQAGHHRRTWQEASQQKQQEEQPGLACKSQDDADHSYHTSASAPDGSRRTVSAGAEDSWAAEQSVQVSNRLAVGSDDFSGVGIAVRLRAC